MSCGCGCVAWPIRTHFIKKINHLSFKSEKASQTSNRCWEKIPNFRTLVEYCKLFKTGTTGSHFKSGSWICLWLQTLSTKKNEWNYNGEENKLISSELKSLFLPSLFKASRNKDDLQPHEKRFRSRLSAFEDYLRKLDVVDIWPIHETHCTIPKIHKPSKEEFTEKCMKPGTGCNSFSLSLAFGWFYSYREGKFALRDR